MRIDIPLYKINEVIDLFNNKPFTEYTKENLDYIRQKTCLGYQTIKNIIIKYNDISKTEITSWEDEYTGKKFYALRVYNNYDYLQWQSEPCMSEDCAKDQIEKYYNGRD